MPPPGHLQQPDEIRHIIYNRVCGNQTNNHYGDITHISNSYNTITRNNYGSNRKVNNHDNNSFRPWQRSESDAEKGETVYGTLEHLLSKSPANHIVGSGSLGENFASYPPHDSHNQPSLEGYPPHPLLTPAILALMGRIQTVTYNNVQGNQTTHTYQNQTIEKEHTVYDEYHPLISGDVYRYRDIHQKDILVYDYQKGETEVVYPKIFTAQVTVSHAKVKGGSGFTAASYQERDAKKLWEHDFRQFAERGDAKRMQLFGLNSQSSVPFLIFHGELIPVAQIIGKIQDKLTKNLARIYVENLAETIDSRPWCIWLDPRTGALMHGTEGPYYQSIGSYFPMRSLPSNVEFLQKDVFWQYLLQLPSNKKPDNIIVDRCCWSDIGAEYSTSNVLSPDQLPPMVVSTLTNSPIAIGCVTWNIFIYQDTPAKPEKTTLQDGTTRFSFLGCKASGFLLTFGDNYPWSWLAQASSIFHHLGISLDEDLFQFKLVHTKIQLNGEFDCSDEKLRRRQQLPFIYLFIRTVPPSSARGRTFVSGWHYWSFDPSGQTSISDDVSEEFGLPTQLFVEDYSFTLWGRYPTESYKTVHRWQVERGFDPKTTDFARYLYPDIPLLQAIDNDASHFAVLDDEDA